MCETKSSGEARDHDLLSSSDEHAGGVNSATRVIPAFRIRAAAQCGIFGAAKDKRKCDADRVGNRRSFRVVLLKKEEEEAILKEPIYVALSVIVGGEFLASAKGELGQHGSREWEKDLKGEGQNPVSIASGPRVRVITIDGRGSRNALWNRA